jgi:phosphoglycolate phosphatase-like HAD superfamily hydrolase
MKAYLFDIDGTLADCSHRLHHILSDPKDWRSFFAGCAGDQPIMHIIELARTLGTVPGRSIVYVSGRSDECRQQTTDWLFRHHLPAGPLYMRKAGDHRDDDVIKLELLEQLRGHGYEPVMAFDDRNRVVAAWRSAGIPCAQVADGNF